MLLIEYLEALPEIHWFLYISHFVQNCLYSEAACTICGLIGFVHLASYSYCRG